MVRINDQYEIESCPDCVVLVEMAEKQKGDHVGERYVRRSRYYQNLSQALDMLIDLQAQGDGVESLKFVVKRIDDIKKDILGVVNELIQAEILTQRGVQAYKNKKT